jgi:hypothetical protein
MYISKGSSDDWLRGVAGIKWIYLLELPHKVLRPVFKTKLWS